MRYRVLAIYTNYPLGGNLVHKQINCTQIKGVQKLHRLKSQPVFSEASKMETNLGVTQPFLTPKSDHIKVRLHESSK